MSAFLDALRARAGAGFVPVIPDLKMISPAEGPLFARGDPAEAALALVKAGAPVLSVVTEEKHFGGSLALLRRIAEAAGVPVLRKDFLQSAADVEVSAAWGASAVLLICSILDPGELREYRELCDELGLSALVEAHDEEEIRTALDAGARIIGVNNRNLKDFTVDTENSRRLRSLIPGDVLFVSESGVRDAGDVEKLREIGVDAVLVGEALMRAKDKRQMLRQLKGET